MRVPMRMMRSERAFWRRLTSRKRSPPSPKEMRMLERIVAPILGIIASCFMVLAAIVSLGKAIIYYMILFAVIMVIGMALKNYGHDE